MASFVNNLVSVEQCDKALVAFKTNFELGIITEKDYQSKVAQIEKRKESLANKPGFQEVSKTVTKTGELTFRYGERQGQTMDLGLVTEVKEKNGKKWLSTVINTGFGHGKYLYSNPEELKGLAKAILDHIDDLEGNGYKFKG